MNVARVGDRVAGAVALSEKDTTEGVEEPEDESWIFRVAALHEKIIV